MRSENEWIVNAWYLYECSMALHGPAYRNIAPPVELIEVQMACVRDLFDEWAPKKSGPGWFKDSHHESYFVLNLCRILYTVMCGSPGSKSEAADWVGQNAGDRWRDLIEKAADWEYGVEVNLRLEALDFLDYVIAEVSKTPLFHRLQEERTSLRPASDEDATKNVPHPHRGQK